MARREPACERCRLSKLACDHQKPVCQRCQAGGDECIYRSAPFKRRRTDTPASTLIARQEYSSPFADTAARSSMPENHYPNPGFLGSLSSTALFSQVSPETHNGISTSRINDVSDPVEQECLPHNALATNGAMKMDNFFKQYSIQNLHLIVSFWRAKGVNLAAAEPFTDDCVESFVKSILGPRPLDATSLLRNSRSPLKVDMATTLDVYKSYFTGINVRWETLGIFVAAIISATTEIDFFPPLYTTNDEKHHFRRLALDLFDTVTEICLSLDCLHDLQLVLKYENFIAHSYVDGDQSYSSWQRLGDVISSTLALGYHEDIQPYHKIPDFLIRMRRSAFLRIYAADKNVAIFLGRPPRLSRRFCQFSIPLVVQRHWGVYNIGSKSDETVSCSRMSVYAYWSGLCASLKEEVLELFSQKHISADTTQPCDLLTRAETFWQELPDTFKLEGSLKYCKGSPFQRDSLLGMRLTYLHVLFLVRLVAQERMDEPDHDMTIIACKIFSLVVEAVICRDYLVNSGTGFLWKVVHYGLPASAILLLSLLQHQRSSTPFPVPKTQILRDLSILVVEIQGGALSNSKEPNFDLLSKAARTIEGFLDQEERVNKIDVGSTDLGNAEDFSLFGAAVDSDVWDFGMRFWDQLADHPSLVQPQGSTFQ
ncbi:hypothetical protein K461DRAFT_225261 [Myriangium duriaei CBS 260.36]|uniref:Zn(2)-C6 fungal-type domain-containing protein n=1 Tax=Myriangium duriaei CBS 260.36 TaxID=1168546 RepID=A0A9P4IZR9_9PEZI|nr:hypothetical protein K461DRAFT_225261 [Myriangium duriaei CBS 260.36]